MFAYCLNNPVVLVDTSGNAAHIGFSADGQPHYAQWKIGSPGGGGWSQDIHYSQQDYGSVAEKFYTVRAAKFVGNRIAHAAHKLWDSYVYSVERTSDLCLHQNITMQLFAHDLFSSPQRVVAFDGVVSYTITASGMFACGITGTPVALIGTAVVSPAVGVVLGAVGIVSGLLQIKWYFEDIHDPRR